MQGMSTGTFYNFLLYIFLKQTYNIFGALMSPTVVKRVKPYNLRGMIRLTCIKHLEKDLANYK